MELIYPTVSIKLLLLLSKKRHTRTEIRKKISPTISTMIFNHIIEVLTTKDFISVSHEHRNKASRTTQVFYITDLGREFLNQALRKNTQ